MLNRVGGSDRVWGAMDRQLRFGCIFVLSLAAVGHSLPPTPPETIIVPSGSLRLMASLWKPPGPGPFPAVFFNHGSGSTDGAHTGELEITDAAARLGPVFVKHGYAFLFLFRRGQGLSAGQGIFLQDALQREKAVKGDEARKRLQFTLLTTEQLDDGMAGLAALKTLPGIDGRRIAVVGHSFGGQITLLQAERDSTLRAAVTFGAAAAAWEGSPEIRDLLLAAVRKTVVPVMLLHPANDYSTEAGRALDRELTRLHKPHLLRIGPAFGKNADEGHMFVYTEIAGWEADVFQFLDEQVKDEQGKP